MLRSFLLLLQGRAESGPGFMQSVESRLSEFGRTTRNTATNVGGASRVHLVRRAFIVLRPTVLCDGHTVWQLHLIDRLASAHKKLPARPQKHLTVWPRVCDNGLVKERAERPTDKEKEKMAKQAVGEVALSVTQLEDLSRQITELDTKIAASSGSDAQIKRAFVEQVVSENADKVNDVLGKVVAQLQKLDTNILVGLTSRLEETLKTEFAPKIEEYVTDQIKDTAKVSESEVAGLKEARKALVEQDKAVRVILDSFGIDVSVVPEPKRSGGGRPAGSSTGSGKSGKNKENYQFTMDGKDRPPSQNTFSSLAYYATSGVPKAVGESDKAEDRWGAKQLKGFLEQNSVKFGEDDEWEVELPNGRKIGARRLSSSTEASAEASTETEAAA